MQYYLLLFFVTYVMGIIAAVPVGAMQVEVVRRTISGRRKEAFALMAGCATFDMVYGSIGLFGLAPFLTSSWIGVAIRSAGALVMILLGVHALRNAHKAPLPTAAADEEGAHRAAFLTGMSLSATNPLIIVWWVLGYKLIADAGLVHFPGAASNILFVVGGVTGMSSYLLIIGSVIRRIQHRLTQSTVTRVIRWCGALLIVFGIVMGIKTALAALG